MLNLTLTLERQKTDPEFKISDSDNPTDHWRTMAEPMVTNDRHAGLKQSQHHPLAGQSQYNTQQEQTLPTMATVDKSNNLTAIKLYI